VLLTQLVKLRGRIVIATRRARRPDPAVPRTSDPAMLAPAAAALADAVHAGALGRLTVERADGAGVCDSLLAQALEEAGFRPTPRGLGCAAEVGRRRVSVRA
jgi:ATP-dependent Lhr-like helicase